MNNGRTSPRISIIAAIGAHDRAIGNNNRLLWHIPDDLKHFKALTLGHPVIMGRKTFESILDQLGGPLPERQNIVVTRDSSYTHDGAVITHSPDEALEKARELDTEEIFIAGGADIWQQTLPLADKLYLTIIDDTQPADAFFPEYKNLFPEVVSRKEQQTPDGLHYMFVELERDNQKNRPQI